MFPTKFKTTRDYSGSRRLQQSSSRAITMHRQVCLLSQGVFRYKDLKLYLDPYGRQRARTYKETPVRHFYKDGHFWKEV